MKERPILFSAPMVRAILEGRKTQTRRAVKPQPTNPNADSAVYYPSIGNAQFYSGERASLPVPCRYGRPSDRLWVREPWAEAHPLSFQEGRPGERRLYAGIPGPPPVDYLVAYRADGERLPIWHCEGFPYRSRTPRDLDEGKQFPKGCESGWVPSIHMPRAASRINLEVTGVRVERLQEITQADTIAEGIPATTGAFVHHTIADYRRLWQSINGAESWAANPWVWVIEFARRLPE